MPPAKKIVGVFVCDPSWRGLGFIVHIPSLNYNQSYLYDLKEFDKSKKYKHPSRTVVSIQKVFDDLFQREDKMGLVDKVIMESQHKLNMQVLSWMLVANLMPRLQEEAHIEYLSPLRWKAEMKVAITKSHYGNKAEAVAAVERNKAALAASETVFDHNTADACLMLNTYLSTTKNIIQKNLDDWSSMALVVSTSGSPGTKFICPKCKQNTGALRICTDENKKTYKKHFMNCWWTVDKGLPTEKKCGAYGQLYENLPKLVNNTITTKSFGKELVWKVVGTDEPEIEEIKPSVGQKRKPEPATKVQPAKKQATEPDQSSASYRNSALIVPLLKKMAEAIKAVNNAVDEQGERFSKIETDLAEIRKLLLATIAIPQTDDLTPEQEHSDEETEYAQTKESQIITKEELDEIEF